MEGGFAKVSLPTSGSEQNRLDTLSPAARQQHRSCRPPVGGRTPRPCTGTKGGGSILKKENMLEQVGLYRLHRVEWLAGHGLPMDVIADRVNLPIEVVERIMYGDEQEDE